MANRGRMEMKKKFIVISLIVVLMFILASCGGTNASLDTGSRPANTAGTESTEENSNDNVVTDTPTVEEQVIFNQDGIVVTVTGFKQDEGWFSFGPSLSLLIENDSSEGIMVQARDASINGIMVDTGMSQDVAIGKKANTELTFWSSYLEKAGIDNIRDIEFKLSISNMDTWDTIIKTDVISVTTSIDSSYVQTIDDSGALVVDQDGVRIVAKELDDTDSFWGADIYLFIENNSGQDIMVQAREVSINGFMISPVFSTDVINGKVAFSELTFFESDLEANSIDRITELELSFHIVNSDSWDTIFDTDSVVITF